MKIKVYTTPTCPYCIQVKKFLKEKGHEFEEIDVMASEEAMDEQKRISGQMGVPVIDINGQIIVGWNMQALEEQLEALSRK